MAWQRMGTSTGGGRGGPRGGESEPGKWNQGTVRDLHHSYQGGRHRCLFTRLRYCIQVWAIILTTCPVGVMLPLSTHPQCWDGRISYQTEKVSKTDLWKRKLWNIRPLHNRSTKEKTGSRRMEEGCHGSGSESALCVAGRREREEDKSEGTRAVGRLLGMWVRRGSLVIGVLGPRKRSKPRYWQAAVHLLASENEYVNWAHQTNYTRKKYIFVWFGSDAIIRRNCRRIYRYCWPWFWVVGHLAMSVVTWFIVIGDLDWDWLLARRT